MSQFISLDEAKRMTLLYRTENENILLPAERGKALLPICETFDIATVQSVINQPGCTGIRIYYGMDVEKKIHAIIVAVNGKDEDMIPVISAETVDSNIIEDSIRCPIICPPPSPLNS